MLAAPWVVDGDVVGHRSESERVNRLRLLGKENVLGATEAGSLGSRVAHTVRLLKLQSTARKAAAAWSAESNATSGIVHSPKRTRPKKAQVAASQRSPHRRK
jgi:hypothetical protein